MTVNRTTLLDLPLPVTGTESGTWGDTTNNGLTQYMDIAIAGTQVLSTDADVTLTSTDGDSSATNIGATTAQYAILRWTATGSTTRNITVPAKSKTYVVINATGGTQSIVLRGAGPTTGVTIIAGEKAHCVWNGTDFVKISSSAAAGGSNTQVQYNSSGVLAGSSNMTFNGTKLTVAGFLDSALTSGRVPYATTSGELTDSANLLYSGTDLTVYGITVGRGAGAVSTNTAVGASALVSNTSGSSNAAFAQGALQLNTTGAQNTALGLAAVQFNTTGANNTGVGYQALNSNTTASNNTAVGYQALYTNTAGNVSAVGYQAGYGNTTGTRNTFFGIQAGYTNATNSYQTYIGYNSGYYASGAYNTAVGDRAQEGASAGSSGNWNTSIGHATIAAVSSGSYNCAMGVVALGSNTTGGSNVAIGVQALQANTTASNNTAVGYQALYNSTGADNTSLGYQAGDVITTGTGNVIIGKGADPSVNSATDQIVIGNGVTGQADTNVTIGNGTGKIYNAYTVNATWTQTSDGTMKNVIGPDNLGLSFINRLNPILFTWKAQNDLPPDHPYYAEENKRDTTRVIHGFVAQEVKAALDAEGCSTFNGWDQGDDGIQAISREMFISPLVKAVQELSAQVEQLKAELAALKGA
jgi:hypothetical protein